MIMDDNFNAVSSCQSGEMRKHNKRYLNVVYCLWEERTWTSRSSMYVFTDLSFVFVVPTQSRHSFIPLPPTLSMNSLH